jgi:hypothetical protein
VVISAVGVGTTLTNEQTGKRTTLIAPPLCGYSPSAGIMYPYVVGGGWLLTSCAGYANPPFQLYSIASGTWIPFSPWAGSPVAVGSQWIEGYGPAEIGCSEHCTYQYAFANVATGQVTTLPSWQPGGTTVPNLNSAGLAATLCSPLRVPHGFPNDLTLPSAAPDPLTLAGPFAAGLDWKLQGGANQLSLLLQRCGTRLRRVLTSQIEASPDNQFAINQHAVIWRDSRPGALHGVFLPSLKKFTIPLGRIAPSFPTAISIFLTPRTLYVWNHNLESDLVAAPAPRQPSE